jgi:hypothetical protein
LGLLAITMITSLISVDSAAGESLNDAIPSPAAVSTSRFAAPGDDWRNTTYTLPCGDVPDRPLTVTVRNGEGRTPGDSRSRNAYLITVWAVATGDLTGDGRAETAVLLLCQPRSANFSLHDVLVFTRGRTLLGRLPVLKPIQGAIVDPQYDRREFRVDHGRLVTGVGYHAPGECHACGPTLYATLVWHWNGRRFETRVPVGASY